MVQFFLFVGAFFFSIIAQGSLDFSSFQSSKLSAWDIAIRTSKQFPRKDSEERFDSGLPSFVSRVEYTGRRRKISKEKSEFIQRYISELASLYKDEIEVLDGGQEFWLPVQTEVLRYLANEVKPGERFTVYYRFAGAAKKRQPIYLMIEFDSSQSKNS